MGGLFGSSGMLGGLNSFLHGDPPPKPKASGAWPNVGPLGAGYSDFLLRRLQQPVEETQQFGTGSTMLRDLLTRESGAAMGRLGDTARTGGFADSGVVLSGMGDINRSNLEAYTSGLNDLKMQLEMQRTAEILPFLAGASGESVALQQLLSQNMLTTRGQNIQQTKDVADFFSSMFSLGA